MRRALALPDRGRLHLPGWSTRAGGSGGGPYEKDVSRFAQQAAHHDQRQAPIRPVGSLMELFLEQADAQALATLKLPAQS